MAICTIFGKEDRIIHSFKCRVLPVSDAALRNIKDKGFRVSKTNSHLAHKASVTIGIESQDEYNVESARNEIGHLTNGMLTIYGDELTVYHGVALSHVIMPKTCHRVSALTFSYKMKTVFNNVEQVNPNQLIKTDLIIWRE